MSADRDTQREALAAIMEALADARATLDNHVQSALADGHAERIAKAMRAALLVRDTAVAVREFFASIGVRPV